MASALTDTLFRAGINHGIYRRTLASTGNGTEIADIRDAVEHHKQRILALLERKGTKSSVFW